MNVVPLVNRLEQQSEKFLNRELSLLEFNRRVLHQAQNENTPLLERMRFLCISSINMARHLFIIRSIRIAAVLVERQAMKFRNMIRLIKKGLFVSFSLLLTTSANAGLILATSHEVSVTGSGGGTGTTTFTSTGEDGILDVMVDTVLSLPADSILNYSSINVATGSTLTFDGVQASQTIYLLAMNDIVINGLISLDVGSLWIGSPTSIEINGGLTVGDGESITLSSGEVFPETDSELARITTNDGGVASVREQPLVATDIQLSVLRSNIVSVSEPPTIALLALGIILIISLHRYREHFFQKSLVNY